MYADLGTTLDKPKISITDYSSKTTDDYGNITITERAYSKRMMAQVLVTTGSFDNVAQILTAYRAVPVVWIGEDDLYSSLIVYGFVVDWGLTAEVDAVGVLNLEVEGLT
jgi:hypothetical protein